MTRTHGRTIPARVGSASIVAMLALATLSGGTAARSDHVSRQTIIPNPTVTKQLGLYMGGKFQGNLASVSGCSVGAVVVGPASWDSTDMHLGQTTSTPCVLEHSLLAKNFMVWLYHELNGTADPATLDIMMSSGISGIPSVAIELTGARLTSLDFPSLSVPEQSGPTTDYGKPVTLRSTIIADAIAFVDPSRFPAASGAQNKKLMSGLFEVRVDGVKKPRVSDVAPFSVDALFGDGITDPRAHGAEAPVWHGGDSEAGGRQGR